MTRRHVRLGGAVLAVAVGLALLPMGLRLTGFFRVRQVELVGVRYQRPEVLLAGLALGEERDLLHSMGDIRERALDIPGVVDARIERRLPGTLRIVIEERTPIAFVPGESGLIALDSEAHPLAYDAAITGFDLPVVERADSVAVRALAAVRAVDSLLYDEVSSARRMGEETVVLELRHENLIFRGVPSPLDIKAVAAVRRHLQATGRRFDRLDARFSGEVFVRLNGA